jgi:hypothetical protein
MARLGLASGIRRSVSVCVRSAVLKVGWPFDFVGIYQYSVDHHCTAMRVRIVFTCFRGYVERLECCRFRMATGGGAWLGLCLPLRMRSLSKPL